MQRMLLQKSKLTLTEVEDTCRASEATARRLKVINAVSDGGNRTDAASEFAMRVKPTVPTSEHQRCKFCGKTHGRGRCPAYGQICSHCKRRNHFAAVCQNKPRVRQLSLECNEDANSGMNAMSVTLDSEPCQDTINTVNEKAAQPRGADATAVYATVQIDGIPMRFQLDTGASCNVIRVKTGTSDKLDEFVLPRRERYYGCTMVQKRHRKDCASLMWRTQRHMWYCGWNLL